MKTAEIIDNPLAARIERRAARMRRLEGELGSFLADQLERVAQLVRWTGATTPAEYLDRIEVWEEQAREHAYEAGRRAGLTEAHERHTHGPLGRPLSSDRLALGFPGPGFPA